MKALYAAVGILALLLSACVTGDEITSYVIDPDGAVAFSTYRLNLTSDRKAEDAKEELTNYIRDVEEKRGDLFAQLAKANAQEVNVAILRRASPASVLITGRIPSLNAFAAYLSEKDEERSFVCSSISRERMRGLRCEFTRNPAKDKTEVEPARPPADSFSETRIALVEGSFIEAQGFLIAHDRRSALLDTDKLLKVENREVPSTTISLEWQIPEAR